MDNPETFEIPSEPFTFQGKTVQLRGLTLAHIIFVVRENREAIERLFEKAIQGELQLDAFAVALELGTDFAPVAGRVIACGLGDPTLCTNMASLPASAQIEALEIVTRLTLIQEGGLEKLMEIIIRTLIKANQVLAPRA